MNLEFFSFKFSHLNDLFPFLKFHIYLISSTNAEKNNSLFVECKFFEKRFKRLPITQLKLKYIFIVIQVHATLNGNIATK